MTDSTPTPECNGDDNCIECCPEVEVSMPGTIAALTAELAQATDERDALLHVRHTLTAERDRYRDALADARHIAATGVWDCDPERATPWVAPGEEYEVRDDLVRDWVEAGAKAERARVRQIIEDERKATCHDPHHDERWCSTCSVIEDVLDRVEAALDEGEDDE